MKTESTRGDAPRMYQAVLAHLEHSLWNDTRNARTLAWMVTGLVLSQRASLSAWLPHIHSHATFAQSTERRVRRWLENPAIDPVSMYGPLVTRALRDWGGHTLVLALDTSVLFEKFCLIRVSVLFRGRAVPLVSHVLEHSSAQVSTAHLLPVLAEVKGLLDFLGICQVRLLADRGFCDTELMGWLQICGWHYRIRIKSSLILAAPDGQRLCKVSEIRLAPRETRCFQNITLTGRHFGPVHVALARPSDGPEQWQVVSDEPTSVETFAEYGERFQIEEGFLDEKSGLFGLEDSKIRDANSLERLILVLSVATLLLVSEGIQMVQRGDQRVVDPHWQRALSYLKIGLRAVQYALSRGQTIFSNLTLQGGPDPEPLRRTRPQVHPTATLEVGWQIIFRSPS
ncbi:transposase [Deinococcus sp. Arct2-2]|uniref:transposase n=1 Tax=Deinococcus sp. Arct2-2 TaxID=2568653 RepID=UPI0010A38C3B|nr:transposase [Deinococcus sp. Arct2-2]THF68532.1 transposase [Deinococcus sp. Arct2-2]